MTMPVELQTFAPPMTPRQLVQQGAVVLERAGIARPRREAGWLLASLLHVAPTWLAVSDDIVTADAAKQFRQLVAVRAAHQPLQYLLGSAFFLGLEFEVTPATLVPRPETELLVEAAAHLLGGRPSLAVDLGTGSGCVAIGLTHLVSACRMVAVDSSLEALQVAGRNARRHGVAERVVFVLGDWDEALRGTPACDLVLSNPPYIPTDELTSLPLDVQQEPRAALDGGPDGLRFHRRLLSGGRRLLRAGGWLVMELGAGQADGASSTLRQAGGWTAPRFIHDHQGIARVLMTSKS